MNTMYRADPDYFAVTNRMAEEIDREYLLKIVSERTKVYSSNVISGRTSSVTVTGTPYDWVVFDELEPEPKEGTLESLRDAKLQQILERQYAVARGRHNKAEMQRLEKQMKGNKV